MNSILAIIAAASLLVSFLGVELVRRWASRNLLDIPNERSSHSVPTPRGGGVAIGIVLIAGITVLQVLVPPFTAKQFAAFTVSCLLILTIGWIDDLKGIANRWRFLVHVIAALIVSAAFGPLTSFQIGPFLLENEFLGWILTIVWIVGLINAFNFMDGIDGIASVQAIIAAIGWFLIGPEPSRSIALLLAASTAGFLLHNWPPARIFMGDVGSGLLGFVIASMPLLGGPSSLRLEWIAFLVVWPFVFDTAFTMIRRWRRQENIFLAHRSHLYQRLVIAGSSQRSVTALYGVLAAIGVLLAWGVARHRISESVALVLVCLMAMGVWALTVSREQSLNRR